MPEIQYGLRHLPKSEGRQEQKSAFFFLTVPPVRANKIG